MSAIVKDLIEISGTAGDLPRNPTIFKQLSVQFSHEISKSKPDIERVIKVLAQVNILNQRVIRTPVGKSLEGQNLTGFKMIVEGEIVQKIEYVASECTQPVHAEHFEIPFSSFVILPQDYKPGKSYSVTGYIEDILVDLPDKRTIFENCILLLDSAV